LGEAIDAQGRRTEKIRHDVAQACLHNFAGQNAEALDILKPLRLRARYRVALEFNTDRGAYRTFEKLHDTLDRAVLAALGLRRGWLAIQGEHVTGDVARRLGVMETKPSGFLVHDVAAGSAAERSGIRHGDVILAINGARDVRSVTLDDILATAVHPVI
jgi:predicted metalloprotease with PDZ domain